jgi:hypothetical protein
MSGVSCGAGRSRLYKTHFEFVWRRGAVRCPWRGGVAGPRRARPGAGGLIVAFCLGSLPGLSFPHTENKLWDRVAGPGWLARAKS